MMTRPLVVAALCSSLAACIDDTPDQAPTTSTSDTATTTGSPDVATATDTTPDPTPDTAVVTQTFKTSIGDWTMAPRLESTRCMHKRLTNTEAIWVTAIETKLAPGSHHLIVYQSSETVEDTEPKECTPFIDVIGGQAYPLMITQIAEERLELPEGVALKLEPGQMIRMEAHYLNYYPEPIVAHADVTFHTVPASEVEHEAGLMLYGTPDIRVPAGQTKSTPWYYLPIWPGVKLFAATGHTHRFGTNVELRKAAVASPSGLANEPVSSELDIYPGEEEYAWDEAPVLEYDPPLAFGEGEGIRYRCSWHNTSNQTVRFGESANQEMCFFWLYYYPSNGYRLCINTGSWFDIANGLIGRTECCPESSVCGLVTSYLENNFGP